LRFGFAADAERPAEDGSGYNQKDKPSYDSQAIHFASVFPGTWAIGRITQGRKARKAELRLCAGASKGP